LACVTNCKNCDKGSLSDGDYAALTATNVAGCVTAADGYGFVDVSSAHTKILACPTNCTTCAKTSDTSAFTAADCSVAASGYYLVGSAGAYTSISACNANCTCSASTDLCTGCKSAYALFTAVTK
jgi:hypothetical protein